jgi:DNA polymerase III delta prime subunit
MSKGQKGLITYPDLQHIEDPNDPATIKDIAFPSERIEAYLKSWVARSTATRNLLLYGSPGTGKTRAAFVLAQARSKTSASNDIHYVECKTGVGTQLVEKFTRTGNTLDKAMNPLWEEMVILDEIDNLKPKEQQELRTILDCADRAVIVVTNNLSKVHGGVRSRCYEIEWTIAEFDKCKPRLTALCDRQNRPGVSETLLEQQVYTTAGWRQMLRNIDAIALTNDKQAA